MLGAVTGMPIGVVNVAIVDAATRKGDGAMRSTRFAIGIGLGGAFADAIHSALAFAGVGHLVGTHPHWTRALAVAAAVIIGGYVAITALRRRSPTPPTRPASTGIVTGLLLTLPNPAPLAAWVAVASAVWPTIALVPALVVGAGVGLGSAAWFTLLARWAGTLPRDGRTARWISRVALALLGAIAVVGVVRALA